MKFCILIVTYCLQPDTITGDIVFVLHLKEHAKFKRKFDDLYVEHTLNLTEALCGFQFALTHLDGRQLLVKSNPGEVIKPGKFPCFMIFIASNLSITDRLTFLPMQINQKQSMMRACHITRGHS